MSFQKLNSTWARWLILNKHLRLALANVLLAGLYYMFFLRYWRSLLEQPRLSHLLVVLMSFLCCAFALARKDPQKLERSRLAVLAATGGRFMPLALLPGAPAAG